MRVSIPVTAKTVRQALNTLDQIYELSQDPSYADYVTAIIPELRADFVENLQKNDVQRMIEHSPLDVIFTLRPNTHGGHYRGAPFMRLAIARNAVECGASYVDVEEDLFVPEQFQERGPKNTRIIVSYHHYDKTPENLKKIYQGIEAKCTPQDIPKIAVMPRNPADAKRIRDLLTEVANPAFARRSAGSYTVQTQGRDAIILGMGTGGVGSRFACGKYGHLTFARMGEGSADGQPTVEELVSMAVADGYRAKPSEIHAHGLQT